MYLYIKVLRILNENMTVFSSARFFCSFNLVCMLTCELPITNKKLKKPTKKTEFKNCEIKQT